MNNNKFYTTIGLIALFVCMGLMGSVSHAAESEKIWNGNTNMIESLGKVEFNGQATNVNFANRSMTVNRENVRAVSNMALKDGTPLTTVFIDENEKPIPFTAFKNNQWVKVTGYKAKDGSVYAKILQRQINQSVDNLTPDKVQYTLFCLTTVEDPGRGF